MKKLLMVVAVVVVLAVPSGVHANSITPTLLSVTPVGLQFDWLYRIDLGLGAAWSSSTICTAAPATPNCPGPPVTGSAMMQLYDFHGWDADGPDNALGAEFIGASADNYPVSHTLDLGPDQLPATADDGTWVLFPNKLGDTSDPDGADNIFGTSDDRGVTLNTAPGSCGFASGCPPDASNVWNLLLAYAAGPTIDASGVGAPYGFGTTLGFLTIRSDLGGPGVLAEARFTQDAAHGSSVPGTGSNSVQTNFGVYQGPSAVPEPASLFLLGTGLLGIGSRLRKKSKKDVTTV
jgi:hypothetical protein